MKPTAIQQKAIDSNGNVLVSAGAGSGKTRVLTERVIKKIIEENVSLDEFLILTFTVDASNEMKKRIKDELIKKQRSDLLIKVDNAHIETFDAYALFITKKYGRKLNLPSNIVNVSDDIMTIKIDEFIDDILGKYYEEKNPIIVDFIGTYCDKNDKILKDFISDIYHEYDKVFDKNNYFENYKKKFLDPNYLDYIPNLFFNKCKDKITKIKMLIEDFQIEKNKQKFSIFFDPFLSCKTLKDYTQTLKLAGSFPRVSKDEYDSEIKEQIKALFDSFKDNLIIDEGVYNETDRIYIERFTPLILDIVKEIEHRVIKFEYEKGAFTFNHVQSLAFKIVSEFKDVREEIKNGLKYIFIDEYQDTSDIQEKFVNLVANENVFCVGDVKQSIYLFRGAQPDNFVKKYEAYKKIGQVIDMNQSFRSRKEVIDGVNKIFNPIMTSKFGGVDYSVNHNLEAKNEFYNTVGKTDRQHGIVKLTYENNQVEVIVEDIKKRIASKMQVYDRDEGVVRDLKYKDIAILCPSKGKFEKIEEELKAANIPANCLYDENVLDDETVEVLISFLKLINNINENSDDISQRRHCFVSIARSFVFELKDAEIYHLIHENTYENSPIYNKVKEFAFNHKKDNIATLYMDLLTEFDFIYSLRKLYNVETSMKKIELFYEKAKSMDDLDYTLKDFIHYLEKIDVLGLVIEAKHDEAIDNSVKVTSIHVSKGLEYKIVYLADICGRGEPPDTDIYFVNNEFGYYLPFISNSKMRCPMKTLFKDELNFKFTEEKMRLLYVALTRAEDVCVILEKDDGKPKNPEKMNNLMCFISLSKINLPLSEFYSMPNVENVATESIKPERYYKYDDINLSFEKVKIKERASKEVSADVDEELLNFGTHMHLLMELVDLKTKETSFIKKDRERKIIDKILNNKLFANLMEAEIYHEYQFYDEDNSLSGIIDLLVIKNDSCLIVDFKLKNIDDEEYKKQLEAYKIYVEKVFKKNAKCYLLSLIDAEIKEVF